MKDVISSTSEYYMCLWTIKGMDWKRWTKTL